MKVTLTQDKELNELQDEVIQTIKNKDKHMKKEKKAPKTYTLKQIIKTVIISLALLSAGAFTGITIEKAISGMIDQQVKEQTASQLEQTAKQVELFTQAVE